MFGKKQQPAIRTLIGEGFDAMRRGPMLGPCPEAATLSHYDDIRMIPAGPSASENRHGAYGNNGQTSDS